MAVAEAAALFPLEGRAERISAIGSGHINDTYFVRTRARNYVLQRINHAVFSDPVRLMANICRVTEHIRTKLTAAGEGDPDRHVLQILPARDGRSFALDDEGNYWRVYPAIEHTTTYDSLEHAAQAEAAAYAFGRFGALLADLPGPPLAATIPHFHDGPRRFGAFQRVLAADSCNRAFAARREIEFLQQQAHLFARLPKLQAEGLLRERVTHNDTKINNVLMDTRTGEGLCVIDLDTVMPGLVLYDFGDMVRTAVGNLPEDAPDISDHGLRLDVFEGLARGYLRGAGNTLSPTERELLVFSGQMMSLLIGTRFLSDFLAGDGYFKVDHPEHNLERCRVQFSLVGLLQKEEATLCTLLRRVLAEG